MMHIRRMLAALSLLAFGASAGAGTVQPGERVVVAGGEITEVIYALGAQDRLVGVDSTSVWPVEARALPQIGYLRTLPVEGILSLRPDRILVTSDAGPATALTLLSQRVPVNRIENPSTPQGLLERIRTIAELVDRQEAGDELIQRLESQFAAIESHLPVPQPPRVLILLAINEQILLVGGRDTAAQDVLDILGLPNAADVSGFIPFNAEAFLHLQPDVLVVAETEPGVFSRSTYPSLSITPAVRNDRVLVLDSMYLLSFGTHLPQALAEVLTLVTGTEVAIP